MSIGAIAVSLFLFLQTGKGTIEGNVLTTANKPIAGAQVILSRSGVLTGVVGGVLAANAAGAIVTQFPTLPNQTTATTDNNGHFVFQDVRRGIFY